MRQLNLAVLARHTTILYEHCKKDLLLLALNHCFILIFISDYQRKYRFNIIKHICVKIYFDFLVLLFK